MFVDELAIKTTGALLALYRQEGENAWSRVEMAYDKGVGWAEGSTGPVNGPIRYWVQAVDGTGNVGLSLDRGNPYQDVVPAGPSIAYLPAVLKGYSP